MTTKTKDQSGGQPRGFTLIEVLVAMAVMAFILVLLLQVLSNTSEITQGTEARVERGTDLRRTINRISADLGRGLFSADLPPSIQKAAGNDELLFFAEVSGYGGERGISKVHYRIGPGPDGVLQRGVRGHSWSGDASVPFGVSDTTPLDPANYDDLGELVFRLECEALMTDGTMTSTQSLTSWANVQAIVVTMVAMDPRTWRRRPDGVTLASLSALFPDSTTTTSGSSALESWSEMIENPTVEPLASLPASVTSGFQVRQRVIPIRR